MVRQFMVFVVLLMLSSIIKAQVIDDSSIKLNQDGNYEFTEGRFVAYLADTVSPTFIRNQFQQLEIIVLDENIEPLLIALVNSPSKERLKEIQSHKNVIDIYRTTLESERANLKNKLSDPTLTNKQKNKIEEFLSAPQEDYIIEFDYSVDVKKAKKIMGEYRDVAYKVFRNSLRTVTLKSEPGTETLLMDKVEQLHFVVSTAMIGEIRD